jgi:translation initiation factor 2 gamma subunit (eIF-2gamma)
LQVTLVDCPGHASLIRTIIGGAQIIDMMLLVVDVTKGEGFGCRYPEPVTFVTLNDKRQQLHWCVLDSW